MARRPLDLIDDILDLPIPTDIKLSPDGSRVVYTTTRKWNHQQDSFRRTRLWMAHTDIRGSARALTSGYWHDRKARWTPGGSSIAFVSDRASPGHSCAIYQLGLDDHNELRPLTQTDSKQEISTFDFSPDGNLIAFLKSSERSLAGPEFKRGLWIWGRSWNEVRLNLLDTRSGSVEGISNKGENIAELAWNDSSTEIAFLAYRALQVGNQYLQGATIYIFEIATRRVRRLFHLPSKASNLVWSGSRIYLLANNILDQDTSGTAIYSADVSTDASLPQKIQLGSGDCCARSLIKLGTTILVYVERGMEDQLVLLNGSTVYSHRNRISSFDAVWPRPATASTRFFVAIARGDLNDPTEVFTYPVGSRGDMIQLSNHAHGTGFARGHIGNCLYLKCPTLDSSERLDGLFLVPDQGSEPGDRSAKPTLPTFVLIHGGPYSRITDCFDTWHPFHALIPVLLGFGYGILIPNYRGSSSRGERFASYARGGMGRYDQPDITAMVQFAISQGLADETKLIVAGWSQGGYLAYLSAVRNGAHGLGWRFAAAVAGAGITDWDSMTMSSDLGHMQAQLSGGSPWTSEGDSVQSRSGSAIWEFKRAAAQGVIPPMLMLHGECDRRVPLAQAIGFQRALDESKLPYQFVIYPGEGHYLQKREHIKDMLTRVCTFTHAIFSEDKS